MTAGAGASEQARLAAERVTRLKSDLAQANETVAQLQRRLQHAERTHRAWNTGAAGELLVADRLDLLEAHGWRILHDLHWPGRPKANLDHVMVGPGGVLVIDAKNWSGDVQLRHGELTQNGSARLKESASALEQAAAIAALLEPQHRQLVQTWLCMAGQPELRAVTASGVRIEGLNTISQSIRALPRVLEPEFVTAIHHYLLQALCSDTSPVLLTTAGVGSGNAAGSSLHQRRLASDSTTRGRTKQSEKTIRSGAAGGSRNGGPQPRQKQRAKKRPGCLAASVQLAGIGLVLAFLLNLLGGLDPSEVVRPQLDPAITHQGQTLERDDDGWLGPVDPGGVFLSAQFFGTDH